MKFFKPKTMALATVTTPGFMPGTMVMLHSFLNNNPWFKGDILIIHDQLPEVHQSLLRRLYPVRFVQTGGDLLQRVQTLIPDYADFERRKAQFYSLEAFRFREYNQLIFMDSDMLVLGSLEELTLRPEPMLACGTVKYYRPGDDDGDPFQVEQFNAGMMRIDGKLLGTGVRQALLDNISSRFFAPFIDWAATHELPRVGTDQIILNTHFGHQVTYVPATFNYRVGIAAEIAERDGCRLEDARIIHYTGGKKPWMADKVLQHLFKQSRDLTIFRLWTQAWADLLRDFEQGRTDESNH